MKAVRGWNKIATAELNRDLVRMQPHDPTIDNVLHHAAASAGSSQWWR
jgi:hypothetical protein